MSEITLSAAPGLATLVYRVEYPARVFSGFLSDAREVAPGKYQVNLASPYVSVEWFDGRGGHASVRNGDYYSPTLGEPLATPTVLQAKVDTTGLLLNIHIAGVQAYPIVGNTGFSVTHNGSASTISSTVITAGKIVLTLSAAIPAKQTVLLSYSPGNIADSAATPNVLAAFSNRAVGNDSKYQAVGTLRNALTRRPY